MIIIYCAKDKQEAALEHLNLSGKPHEFCSPTSTGVNYYASKVYVVGNHPSIVERYKGIQETETITLEGEDGGISEE